jgi:translation initiation factor IF-1
VSVNEVVSKFSKKSKTYKIQINEKDKITIEDFTYHVSILECD